MKLDVDVLRYLSKDDFRVLTAVELGMRNVRLFLSITPKHHYLFLIFQIWTQEVTKILPLPQHEIVPTELIDRIARLKYLSMLFYTYYYYRRRRHY